MLFTALGLFLTMNGRRSEIGTVFDNSRAQGFRKLAGIRKLRVRGTAAKRPLPVCDTKALLVGDLKALLATLAPQQSGY